MFVLHFSNYKRHCKFQVITSVFCQDDPCVSDPTRCDLDCKNNGSEGGSCEGEPPTCECIQSKMTRVLQAPFKKTFNIETPMIKAVFEESYF